MAKTNRISKLYKTRQTAIQLEKLEHRQLLATVTGGGEEVGSDISYQGNVYDQVLMQGAAVSVEADPGQIVRVSWIDGNGDITQGEFSGAGTFTVSLDDFVEAAEPENYNQPGVEYASGHASITIEGSNASSNVSVFTVGPTTAHNFGALDTGVDLDGVADIARITIVADPSQPGGSTFGGIRTANVMYSDDTGVVGIAADGVQVQTVVLIGDIDASNSGIPTLLFGDNSQFGTLQIAGGDLAQTNGEAINEGGFETLSFIDGMTSDGVLMPAGVLGGNFLNGEYRISALDTSTVIDIEGKSQAELDALFSQKTFTEDVTIVGDLASFRSIKVSEFQGNVTLDGVYDGSIDLGTVGGDITFMGTAIDPEAEEAEARTISSNITVDSLGGNLVFGSEMDSGDVNYTGTAMISSMGEIQVYGDFSGMVTTDTNSDDSFDAGEGALGSIHVSGDFSGNAVGISGIGNITVVGNLTSSGSAFYTSSDDGQANIGSLTVMGDVDQADGDMLINIAVNGSFGAITLGGGTEVGMISIGGSLLGGSNGDISITGAGDVDVNGIELSEGALGHLTITGDGEGDLTLGDITAGAIGNVTVSGFGTISLNEITVRTSGMLDFSGDTMVNGAITVGHQLGALTITGDATIDADITSAWMGPVMIDGNATFADGVGLVSGDGTGDSGRLVSLDVTGNTTFNSESGPNLELSAAGDLTFGGAVSGSSDGVEIMASNLGDLSFTGALSGNQALVADLTVRAVPRGGDGVEMDGSNLGDYSIGNITVESTNTIGIPGASLFAGNTAFHALGAIGDISLTGGGSATAQTPLVSSDADKLLFIVGDTSGDPTGAPTIDFDGDGTNDDYADFEGGTVSIGNVSIDSAPVGSDYDTVGFTGNNSGDPDATAAARFTGMNILAGVHADDGQINAVENKTVNMAALWAAYNTAQGNLETVLDGADPDELFAAVTAAEAVLGTPDDAGTEDVDETSGLYIALAEAQAAVDEAQKAIDAVQTSFNEGLSANADLIRARADLGLPGDDPDTETEEPNGTGAYLDLFNARGVYTSAENDAIGEERTALEGEADDDESTGTRGALADAEQALTDAKQGLTDAQANARAVQAAYAAAAAADDGSPTAAQYRAAFVADALFDFDVDPENTDLTDDNPGRVAYVETAVLAGMPAEATKAWDALSAADKEARGRNAWGGDTGNTEAVNDVNWANKSAADKLSDGREAYIADFVSLAEDTDEGGTTATTAHENGLAVRNSVETGSLTSVARLAFAAIAVDDRLGEGRAAVAIKAARDADINFGDGTDPIPEEADDITELVTALNGHRTTFNGLVDTAETRLGEAGDDASDTLDDGAYANLAFAQDAFDEDVAELAAERVEFADSTEATTWANAQAAFAAAEDAYFDAIVGTSGITTEEDVTAVVAKIVPLNAAVGVAQTAVDNGITAVAEAKAELPVGLAAAQDAYDAASKALDDAGARGLGSDEILARNDGDLGGTIGDVDIRNMTTLLSATEVGDITNDLGVRIISASAITAATDVGSVNGMDTLEDSRDGVLVGGNDGDLEEDELLVYIV